MNEEEVAARLAVLEQKLSECQKAVTAVREWTDGELQSCIQSINANGAEIVRLDRLVRGDGRLDRGIAGQLELSDAKIASRLDHLEQQVEGVKRQTTWVMRTLVGTLLAVVASIAHDILTK